MTIAIGDVKAGSTINIPVTTNAANGSAIAPSAPFTTADFQVYKDNLGTPRASVAGWTVTSPVNSVVGQHRITLNLSDNTDAGFYAAGHDYYVVLNPPSIQVDSEFVVP